VSINGNVSFGDQPENLGYFTITRPAPLITRIEAVVDAAIASGATQEVALMSWLHQHLTAAHSLLAGAETFHVSEAGKAVLAEIKALK
jgi:hypothetical protein